MESFFPSRHRGIPEILITVSALVLPVSIIGLAIYLNKDPIQISLPLRIHVEPEPTELLKTLNAIDFTLKSYGKEDGKSVVIFSDASKSVSPEGIDLLEGANHLSFRTSASEPESLETSSELKNLMTEINSIAEERQEEIRESYKMPYRNTYTVEILGSKEKMIEDEAIQKAVTEVLENNGLLTNSKGQEILNQVSALKNSLALEALKKENEWLKEDQRRFREEVSENFVKIHSVALWIAGTFVAMLVGAIGLLLKIFLPQILHTFKAIPLKATMVKHRKGKR